MFGVIGAVFDARDVRMTRTRGKRTEYEPTSRNPDWYRTRYDLRRPRTRHLLARDSCTRSGMGHGFRIWPTKEHVARTRDRTC